MGLNFLNTIDIIKDVSKHVMFYQKNVLFIIYI